MYPTADVRWCYAIWSHSAVCITPNVNLISNIGFGPDAGHTFLKDKILGQDTHTIGTLVHLSSIDTNKEADLATFFGVYHKTIFQKLYYVVGKKLLKLFR